jgi:hypothetical protein
VLALIFSHQASHNALALVAQTPQRLSDRFAQQRQDLLVSCCHFVSRCVLLELHPLTLSTSIHLHLHPPPEMEVESAPPSLQYDCFPGTTLTKNLAQKSRKRKSEGKHKRTRFPQSAVMDVVQHLFVLNLRRNPHEAKENIF